MKVLLSINPEHVRNIFSGRKKFEFRRRIFARNDISTVVVYCTRPVGKIVGEFDIKNILHDAPEEVWKKTCHGSGITKNFFDSYFHRRKEAFAIEIGTCREFTTEIDPYITYESFCPPQSFMYIENDLNLREPQQLNLFATT